ncbi:MAG: type II secretion system F family protein [bacterium]|nr:type II secretion system F family protein [bacterium]
MIFTYQARTADGATRNGTIEAPSLDSAVQSLQRQNLIIVSLLEADQKGKWYERSLGTFTRIKPRDIMLLSRQLSTLFEAKVPVVQTFRTLIGDGTGTTSSARKQLIEVLEDVQGGMSMSQAMSKHPKVFSAFFVSMVRSGEESGKLDEVFLYLADYLERNYILVQKARNALVYPGFILMAFLVVLILMLTVIIPKLSLIIAETGQQLPIYTRAIIAASDFLRAYGIIFIFLGIGGIIFLFRYLRTPAGQRAWSRTQISLPIVGELFRKLYLARLADNLQTLINGGIPIVRALQITADVVGNEVYRGIVLEAVEAVRGGSTIADAFAKHKEIPPLLTQMMKVGEETGKLDQILKALSRFYAREVDSMVDNLVSLIEPVLIIVLGAGIGLIVASVLVPIYNLTAAF